jgi:hypothetical protein
VGVDECMIPMEVDTGASVTIMSEPAYQKLWPAREELRSLKYEAAELINSCCGHDHMPGGL